MSSRLPPPSSSGSRFSKLARTHAAMAAGDAAMVVALADSVLFSIDADAARSRVLLFLGITFVPFLFVAPLIGPAIDRMPGGRRLLIQITTVLRIAISVAMAFYVSTLLLFPLAFGAMVLQKTYTISKSALVPSVVRSEEELVEANSKLGLISGLVAVVAVIPAGVLQLIGPAPTLVYSAGLFVVALVYASRLPREVVAARAAGRSEREELHTPGVILAASAMLMSRATVGFTFFHLFFWFRKQDAGLVWFGLSIGVASVLTMAGNAIAPALRSRVREETMLFGALVLVGITGLGTAVLGGVVGGMLLAGSVNFAAAVGRLAFESIVQSDAPDANRGRAFAQFETKFQLGWVAAGVIPVLLTPPGRVGCLVVGLMAAAAGATYFAGTRAVHEGRRPPRPLHALREAGTNRHRRPSAAARARATSANRGKVPPPPGRRGAPRGRGRPSRSPRPLAPPRPPRPGHREP
ncbi:MAG: MFS transporter [Ilumatobacteraceae bacterium]